MPKYIVFQTYLSDEQIDRLNGPNGGWSSEPIFELYAKLTMGFFRDKVMGPVVKEAVQAGLYQKVASANVESLEEVFVAGNLWGSIQQYFKVFPGQKMKSVSVGDIIYEDDSDSAWLCDSRGWYEINSDNVRSLL